MDCIGSILNKTFKELGIAKPVHRYQALHLWSLSVGDRISSVTEPKKIQGDKIVVKVISDSWRHELIYHKTEIIKKLNSRIGTNSIKDIIWI